MCRRDRISVGVKRAEELGRDQRLVGVSIPIPVLDSNRGNLLEALKREDKARDEHTALWVRLTGDVLQARERLSNSRLELESLRRDVLPGAQPVSYTHLDVYKRQAMEAADIVIMNDDLRRIPEAIQL